MTQPINRETAIALAKEAGMAGMLTDVVCSLEEIHRLCNLAVAHSRKDAEPVAWLNPTSSFSVITQEEKNLNSLQYSDEFLAGHTTPLYAHPPEADKLTFEAAWAEMEKRGYRYGRDALAGVKFGWKLHEDWNTTNPPEADKLLQQALEAVLDEHLPGFTEDAPRDHWRA